MTAADRNPANAVPQLPQRGFRRLPHPAALLLVWLLLAVCIQFLPPAPLLLAGGPLVVVAWRLSAARLIQLLRRTRWIMLSLLLIYGYATPGAAVWEALSAWGPTLEGLQDGFVQLCRLVLSLAALSVVLSLLSRAQLVGGLYVLAYPLRLLGVSRERFAVRLGLTLHYAESAMRDMSADWRGRIECMLAPAPVEPHCIEIHAAPFTRRDGLLVAAAAVALAWVLL